MQGLNKMTRGTKAEKLKFLFDVYDVDGKVVPVNDVTYCVNSHSSSQ